VVLTLRLALALNDSSERCVVISFEAADPPLSPLANSARASPVPSYARRVASTCAPSHPPPWRRHVCVGLRVRNLLAVRESARGAEGRSTHTQRKGDGEITHAPVRACRRGLPPPPTTHAAWEILS